MVSFFALCNRPVHQWLFAVALNLAYVATPFWYFSQHSPITWGASWPAGSHPGTYRRPVSYRWPSWPLGPASQPHQLFNTDPIHDSLRPYPVPRQTSLKAPPPRIANDRPTARIRYWTDAQIYVIRIALPGRGESGQGH
jgi:hypothetical protein